MMGRAPVGVGLCTRTSYSLCLQPGLLAFAGLPTHPKVLGQAHE